MIISLDLLLILDVKGISIIIGLLFTIISIFNILVSQLLMIITHELNIFLVFIFKEAVSV